MLVNQTAGVSREECWSVKWLGREGGVLVGQNNWDWHGWLGR